MKQFAKTAFQSSFLQKIISTLLAMAILCSVAGIGVFSADEQDNGAFVPVNFMAIADAETMTLSWTNKNTANVARIDVYDGSNTRIAGSSVSPAANVTITSNSNNRIGRSEGECNILVISGLNTNDTYTYRLKVTYSNWDTAEFYTRSYTQFVNITGWNSRYSGENTGDVVVTPEAAYDGEFSLRVNFNPIAAKDAYIILEPKLSAALQVGESYALSFWAKAEGSGGFQILYGENEGDEETIDSRVKDAVAVRESGVSNQWQTYTIGFVHTGGSVKLRIDGLCENLYLDGFKLSQPNAFGQPEGENYLLNGSLEAVEADRYPQNLMVVDRDQCLSVSWVNPQNYDIAKIELFDEYGSLVASSANEISAEPGQNNYLELTGLLNEITYSYTLKIRYADGYEITGACASKVLANLTKTLWGGYQGNQSFYGWNEAVNGFPCIKFDVQSEVAHDGRAALMVRSNTGDGISSSHYEQLGPELTDAMVYGETYRFSYWRKNVNAKDYWVYYGNDTNAAAYHDTRENADWEQITLPDFVHDGNTLRFRFNKGAEAIYIDDVALYKVADDGTVTGENLLTNGNFETLDQELNQYVKEIKALLDACEEQGIATDYEVSEYMVLSYFADYLHTDKIKAVLDETQQQFNLTEYMEIYNSVKTSLEQKLAGEGDAYSVPKYVTSPIGIDGQSFLATVEKDGEQIENQPVFYVGFVGHTFLRGHVQNFEKFGFNIIQPEIGPDSIMVAADNEKGWTVDLSGVKRTVTTLKRAANYNVAVNLLISPHYMPDFMYEKYPEIATDGEMHFDVTNTVVREFLSDYLQALIPLIKNEPALHSICLTNEPAIHSIAVKNNPELTKKWTNYLTDRYGSIETLNSVYGAQYVSFADVKMPEDPTDPTRPLDDASAIYNDYMCFNDGVSAEYHKFLAETIKKYAPDIPLHTKFQNTIFYKDVRKKGDAREITYRGNNYEELSKFLEINGNDAYGHVSGAVIRDFEKQFLYDLQRSVKDAPVYNSEEHLGWTNNSEVFEPKVAKRVYTDLWDGAIFGRSATTMWNWDRAYIKNSSNYNCILHRPMALRNAAKVTYDLNRLADEVTAFQDKKADVAILYSHYSRNASLGFLATVYDAYCGALLAGQKVQFVTDDTIADIHEYPALIVPHAIAVKDSVVKEIAEYVQNGGKVMLMGDYNFKYNELKSDDFSEERINQQSTVLNSSNTTRYEVTYNVIQTTGEPVDPIYPARDTIISDVSNWLYNTGLDTVKFVDANTGKSLQRAGWQWVQTEDGWLISVANYDWEWADMENVKVLINGKEQKDIKDILNGEALTGTFSLNAHEPRLLKISAEDFYVSDIQYKKDGKTVLSPEGKNTEIKVSVHNQSSQQRSLMLTAAIYNMDGVLCDVLCEVFTIEPDSQTGGVTEISIHGDFPIEDSNYSCKIFTWDTVNALRPLPHN